MKYQVKTPPEAKQKIKAYIRYLAEEGQAPLTAVRVFRRLLAAKNSLTTFPRRCPRAPEDAAASKEIRC